jgi:hypothetical protein
MVRWILGLASGVWAGAKRKRGVPSPDGAGIFIGPVSTLQRCRTYGTGGGGGSLGVDEFKG